MSSIKIALFAVVAAFSLAACDNTIRGAGQDINDSANAVEQSVQ